MPSKLTPPKSNYETREQCQYPYVSVGNHTDIQISWQKSCFCRLVEYENTQDIKEFSKEIKLITVVDK